MAYTPRVIFIETPVFTRQIKELIDDDMLLAYAKNVRDDLRSSQLKMLRGLVREEFE